jgi:hypothetical protein
VRQEATPLHGIAAYVPAGARGQGDEGILDAVVQLAIPLVRTASFPTHAPAAFFPAHALADPQLVPRMRQFLAGGGRALITSRIAPRLGGLPRSYADRVFLLNTSAGPAGLMKLPQTTLDRVRNFVLFPMGLRISAPPRVALTLVSQRELRVTNHNPYAAGLKLSFRRPLWPEIAALRTGNGETSVPVDFNLAQVQVGPRTTRSLQLVTRGPEE